MNAAERRQVISRMLSDAEEPLSATALASECGVSRQIIVGDVALLRAGGMHVLSTPRGYVMESVAASYTERSVVCRHNTDRIREELYLVVDQGGMVVDVTVEHSAYGQLVGQLHVSSRYDADMFLEKLSKGDVRPLCDLTHGIHLHTLRAPNDATMDRILHALDDAGFLLQG